MNEPIAKIAPHKSSLGNMDANILAMLVYIAPIILAWIPVVQYVAWAAPLVIYFIEKESSFVRFHAMQAILLNAVGAIIGFILSVLVIGSMTLTAGGYWGAIGLVSAIALIVTIAIIVLEVIAIIKAYGYQQWKIPLIGNLAEKWCPINSSNNQ